LPFDVLLEHGFQINKDDYHLLYDEILENRWDVDYEKTMSKIKMLKKNRSKRKYGCKEF